MSHAVERWAIAALLAGTALSAAPLTAQAPVTDQAPVLRATFAAGANRGAVAALAWLCDDYLPSLPNWPQGLDPRQAFALELSLAGVRFHATTRRGRNDVAAAGSLAFGDGPTLLFECATDGTEDWFVPAGFHLPTSFANVLHALEADVLDTPRRVATAALVAHFAGAQADGDAHATALQLGASSCGEVTWLAWRDGGGLRVRGRSGGGLTLPAVLLALAVSDGSGTPQAIALRAFAAGDADRDEAARQLGRDDRPLDLDTLRALLHGDDTVRLAAIDALVRRDAAEELPRIVAAADDDAPWATLAAGDAVRALWRHASPATRQATRRALLRSDSLALRALDLAPLEPPLPAVPDGQAIDRRARLLMLLTCTAIGLFGFVMRERQRARAAACHGR